MPNTYACKLVSNPNVPIFLLRVCTLVLFIKNVERASTARARESRDFHVRGTESGPNDV